jgi:hypothetical protein
MRVMEMTKLHAGKKKTDAPFVRASLKHKWPVPTSFNGISGMVFFLHSFFDGLVKSHETSFIESKGLKRKEFIISLATAVNVLANRSLKA